MGGKFTGKAIVPLCYGRGKLVHAERFAAAQGISLGDSYFYTDSITDMPMLERVGNPRVVSPDPRLRREARQRGWQVWEASAGTGEGGRAAPAFGLPTTQR